MNRVKSKEPVLVKTTARSSKDSMAAMVGATMIGQGVINGQLQCGSSGAMTTGLTQTTMGETNVPEVRGIRISICV